MAAWRDPDGTLALDGLGAGLVLGGVCVAVCALPASAGNGLGVIVGALLGTGCAWLFLRYRRPQWLYLDDWLVFGILLALLIVLSGVVVQVVLSSLPAGWGRLAPPYLGWSALGVWSVAAVLGSLGLGSLGGPEVRRRVRAHLPAGVGAERFFPETPGADARPSALGLAAFTVSFGWTTVLLLIAGLALSLGV